ncbi:hypothetical protein WKW80_36965, partial [Variovorax humicola]
SLQDTSIGQSRQSSSGLNLSVCIPPICYGAVVTASGSASSAKADGVFISPGQQSGIKAGDGGFDVNVKGNTDFKGAVIESTQAAIDNKANNFQTGGTLTMGELHNVNASNGSSYAVSGGLSLAYTSENDGNPSWDPKPGQQAVPPTGSAGLGRDDGSSQNSVTKSGISGIAGDQSVRTGDGSSAGALVKDWDTQTIVKDVQAQAQLTQQFNQQAAQAAGSYANQKFNELKNTDPTEAAKWAEGGEYRVALHTVAGGLSSGLQGALGAGASQLAIDQIGQQIANADLPLVVKQTLVELAGAAIGAAVGGSAGAASGYSATVNNYLTVADLTGNKGTKKDQQTQSLANNAKVEDACLAGNGGACGKAIAQAASDIGDLRDYRTQLLAQKDSATDQATKTDLAYQITVVDKQIDSANNAIRVGGMAMNGGNFELGKMTDKELIAMGFAFDPLGAAEVRAAGKASTAINTIADNIVLKAEQAQRVSPVFTTLPENAQSVINGLNLNKSLASQQQLSQLESGNGINIAGSGTNIPLRNASRLASEYGGQISDWSKVSSASYTAADGLKFEIHAYRNTATGRVVEPKSISIK